jgi:hypothetical protein
MRHPEPVHDPPPLGEPPAFPSYRIPRLIVQPYRAGLTRGRGEKHEKKRCSPLFPASDGRLKTPECATAWRNRYQAASEAALYRFISSASSSAGIPYVSGSAPSQPVRPAAASRAAAERA